MSGFAASSIKITISDFAIFKSISCAALRFYMDKWIEEMENCGIKKTSPIAAIHRLINTKTQKIALGCA